MARWYSTSKFFQPSTSPQTWLEGSFLPSSETQKMVGWIDRSRQVSVVASGSKRIRFSANSQTYPKRSKRTLRTCTSLTNRTELASCSAAALAPISAIACITCISFIRVPSVEGCLTVTEVCDWDEKGDFPKLAMDGPDGPVAANAHIWKS